MDTESPMPSSPAIVLALQFYQNPLLLREWLGKSLELPEGIGELVRVAGARQEGLQAAARTYQVDPDQLGEATRFFLQQVLLEPGAGHYRVLGVGPGADSALIRQQHRLLMRLFHPDRHAGQECWTDVYAVRVNEAYNVLRRPDDRASYDDFLSSQLTEKPLAAPSVTGASVAVVTGPLPFEGRRQRPAEGALNDSRWPWLLRRWRGVMLLAGVLLSLMVMGFFDGQLFFARSHYPEVAGNAARIAITQRPLGSISGAEYERVSTSVWGENKPDNKAGVTITDGSDHSPGRSPDSASMLIPAGVTPTSIPRSRDVIASALDYQRTSLIIPPSRRVVLPGAVPTPSQDKEDVPAPHSQADRKPNSSSLLASPTQDWSEKRADTNTATPEFIEGGSSKAADEVVPMHPPELQPGSLVRSTGGTDSASGPQRERAFENPFGDRELMSLVGQLVRSYQEGDLVPFVSLFTADAATTDEVDRQQIEAEYRHLFSSTSDRSLEISGLHWQVDTAGAVGEGLMVIRIRRGKRRSFEKFAGHFRMDVIRERLQLRIARLFYDLERL